MLKECWKASVYWVEYNFNLGSVCALMNLYFRLQPRKCGPAGGWVLPSHWQRLLLQLLPATQAKLLQVRQQQVWVAFYVLQEGWAAQVVVLAAAGGRPPLLLRLRHVRRIQPIRRQVAAVAAGGAGRKMGGDSQQGDGWGSGQQAGTSLSAGTSTFSTSPAMLTGDC